MDTVELMSSTREQRLAELGTEPPCPFCQRPRVRRSDYVRCLKCGINWLDGEDLTRDPKIARFKEVVRLGTKTTASSRTETSDGAPTAR
jgi:ribosomal protein L37AE/L43A